MRCSRRLRRDAPSYAGRVSKGVPFGAGIGKGARTERPCPLAEEAPHAGKLLKFYNSANYAIFLFKPHFFYRDFHHEKENRPRSLKLLAE